MDFLYEHHGATFVWDSDKAALNLARHDGVTFKQAATVFFDPLFRLVPADRNAQARDAIIGYDETGRLLFVVHVVMDGDHIRIISARRATNEERRNHEHS